MTPTVKLPGSVRTPRLTLRRWTGADISVMARAITESLDHLRPWMSWAAAEPLSPGARAELVDGFERNFAAGTEVVYGAFFEGVVVGGSGFSVRDGGILEIGYWLHCDHLGSGYAAEMASALVDAAFEIEGVDRVEIHHDRANLRSGAVPARLGFTFAGERPDPVMAPAETGIDCSWVVRRPDWPRRRDPNSPRDRISDRDQRQ